MRKLSVVKYRSNRVLSLKALLWIRLFARWKRIGSDWTNGRWTDSYPKGYFVRIAQWCLSWVVQERFGAILRVCRLSKFPSRSTNWWTRDLGVTFEDVMELCDVHANLFKMLSKVSKLRIPSTQVTQFGSSRKKIWLSVLPWFAYAACSRPMKQWKTKKCASVWSVKWDLRAIWHPLPA